MSEESAETKCKRCGKASDFVPKDMEEFFDPILCLACVLEVYGKREPKV